MSAKRMALRHPASPPEKLLTTREEIVAFAAHISKDPTFCVQVLATAETVRHNAAIVAEHNKRQAWPSWRKLLHRLWLRFR